MKRKLKPKGVLGVALFWVTLIIASYFPIGAVSDIIRMFLIGVVGVGISWAVYEVVVTLWEN